MSRIQQKRTGTRVVRVCLEARETRLAINSALDRMGIARPRWGSEPKVQDRRLEKKKRSDESDESDESDKSDKSDSSGSN